MSYQKLVDRFQEIYRLEHAITFLSWDQMVMMPERGNSARSSSIAELASIKHQLLTGAEMGDWFADVEDVVNTEHSVSLREMQRVWREATCLPADLVVAKIKAGSHCEHGWRTQRPNNDWAGFLKNFTPVVALAKEEAQLRQQASDQSLNTPYEALLDLHCAGDSQSMIDGIFAELRTELPSLLQLVQERQAKTAASRPLPEVKGNFPVENQKALCEELMAALGFEFAGGRLDESMHPFSTGMSGDLRITTRFSSDEFIEALNATAHEVGHALYQGGLPAATEGLPVGNYRSMCIHESQSLLFEKQIGISKAFTSFFIDNVHKHLPDSKNIDANNLWRITTAVKPGFIRVEADEVCYPLHVLLRYEIESALINGEIEPDLIPELWNSKMQDYLGLSTDGDYANGCLQDIHWTDGAFGYFPSYTVGAVNSAQIFAALCNEHPDWQSRVAAGDLDFVRTWLGDNIWSRGCELTSQELMVAATGSETNTKAYLAHLKARYLEEHH